MWWGTRDIPNDESYLYMMRYGYTVENQEVGHAVDQEQTAHCYVLTWQCRFFDVDVDFIMLMRNYFYRDRDDKEEKTIMIQPTIIQE